MIGRTVSHYRILEELGRGGMGVVYKAEDTKLGRTVALKFLPAEYTSDPEARERFIHEARAAAALNHPNICTIHEIDESDERHFIAMEYVEGESLKERIAARPLPIDTAIDITRQIAAGLTKAHEQGIVHRDIKSANIMVTRDGQAKIMDFGLAKSRGVTKLTREGTTLGTIEYMSPEQARGDDVDHRSDIWSLGAVFYEMLAGRPPFKGDYEQAAIYSILNDDPEPLTAVRTGVPPELERIVSKCLEKEPGERYQTASGITADLRHFVRIMEGARTARVSGPAAARPSTAGRERQDFPAGPGKRPGRKYGWIPWAAVIVLVGALAVTVLPKLFRQAPESTVDTASEQLKKLVVLPFENLGSPDDEYFADGITDAITARLAGLSGLGVISRQSAVQYKNSDRSIRRIAEELGVDFILEGTIQRERPGDPHSRVRIIPQLIRCADDIHLWAGTYDEEMTDIFRLQSEIAERVAGQLDVTLLGRERSELTSQPTDNFEAYEYYLQAIEHSDRRINPTYARLMVELLEKAVETDPGFAAAWAKLADAHVWMYWMQLDDGGVAKAENAVEHALRIDPELPEAQLALGYINYYGKLDFDKALEYTMAVLKKRPNDVRAIEIVGYIKRRQGLWEEALDYFERIHRIDPRNFMNNWDGMGNTLLYLRRFDDAERFTDRAIAMKPDVSMLHLNKALIFINRDGDAQKAREAVERALALASPTEICFLLEFVDTSTLIRICYSGAYELLDQLDIGQCEEQRRSDRVYHLMLEYLRRPDEAAKQAVLQQADSAVIDIEGRSTFDRYAAALEYSLLSSIYVRLGRTEEALRTGRIAVSTLPISKDAMTGTDLLYALAEVYAMAGEYESAIDQLEILLAIPSFFTVNFCRLDPMWDPIRDNPRFVRLLEQYSE